MKKNDEFEIDITDIGNDGEGIGRCEGMTFFVKGAVIGDRILAGATRLKKTYGYARVVKIITPSPFRVQPQCPVAKRCGGCQLQNLDYAKQLEYKQDKVKNNLMRLGKIAEERFGGAGTDAVCFSPIIGMDNPENYRNKGQFPVGCDREGNIVTGFYAGHTHEIISCDSCMIQHPITGPLMQAVREYMAEAKVSAYDEEHGSGTVRHVLTRVGFTTHEVMVCMVINADSLPKTELLTRKLEAAVAAYNSESCRLRAGGTADSGAGTDAAEPAEYRLTSLTVNINKENTNVILGDRCSVISGQPYITDYIGDVCYRISPLSFYQVNPVQTRRLYSTALDFAGLTGTETVWDIYCGIGTISLFLARKARRVFGIEIVPQAIEDAGANAVLNRIDNAEFFVGAAEEVLPAKYASDPSMRADVIVVDPPRKGCDESLLECICKLEPDRIVYVSCDSATLARDVHFLEERGYTLKKVTPCDMFPHSVHVETVCLLSKLHEAKHHINVKVDMDELDLTSAEAKATYKEIEEWVKEHYGFHVTNLNIAQVKQKHGIMERENYNKPKSENSRQPGTTPEKENAITEALKFFKMI